jgi:hypothetical protein
LSTDFSSREISIDGKAEKLEGKTPAEACGITIEGQNKWKTLIQNASSKNLK